MIIYFINIVLDFPLTSSWTFQDPASLIMENIIDLHHDIIFLEIAIIFFVLWMTTFLIPKNIKNKFLIFTMNKIQHYVFFWIKNIVLKNNNIRSDITFSKNGFNPCDFFIFILFVCGIYAVIKIVVDETDSNGIEAYKNFVDSTGIALEIALEEEKKAKEKYEKAIKEEKKS